MTKHKSKPKRGSFDASENNPFDIAPAPTSSSGLKTLRIVEIAIFIAAVLIGLNAFRDFISDEPDVIGADLSADIAQTPVPTELPTFDGWMSIGQTAYNAGDYLQAESAFTNAIEFESENADAYYRRGLSRFYEERYEASIADLTRALTFGYEPPSFAYYFRGRSYQIQGEYKRAIENYTQSIELCSVGESNTSDCHLDWMRRGETHLALNQFDKALADLQKSLDIEASAEAANGMLAVYDEVAAAHPDEVTAETLLPYQMMSVKLNAGLINEETIADETFAAGEPYIVTFEMIAPDEQLHITFEAEAGDTFRVSAERIPRLTGARPSDINPVILIEDASGQSLAFRASGTDKLALIEAFTAPESGTYTVIVAGAGAATTGKMEVRVAHSRSES